MLREGVEIQFHHYDQQDCSDFSFWKTTYVTEPHVVAQLVVFINPKKELFLNPISFNFLSCISWLCRIAGIFSMKLSMILRCCCFVPMCTFFFFIFLEKKENWSIFVLEIFFVNFGSPSAPGFKVEPDFLVWCFRIFFRLRICCQTVASIFTGL